jgi:hypothetical protein
VACVPWRRATWCRHWLAGAGEGHAIALGAALLAIGILVQSQYWQLLPVWYHVIFLAGLLPVSLLGARLRAGRTPSA